MKELSHYLHDLDEVQWLTFLQYLELLPDKNEPWKKIRQLAELVRGEKDKNLGAAYYSKILYGEEKTDTIERMERMLKKRYLEFITLDYNLSADEKDFDYVSIQLEKKATAFRTLSRTKNSHGSERDLLDEIIKVAKEYEFYGLFYNKEYIKVEECIRFILAHSSAEESGEFHYAIFNLLLANVLFMQKKFAEALQLLQGPLEISQDKAGWAIGLRLLRILIHIELAKHDEASKQIEQLRKFIEFTESNQTEVTLRNKTIVKFLSLADKAGFVFSRLNGKAHEHLSELKTGNNGNAWEYFSSELIPIHEWATSTTKKP